MTGKRFDWEVPDSNLFTSKPNPNNAMFGGFNGGGLEMSQSSMSPQAPVSGMGFNAGAGNLPSQEGFNWPSNFNPNPNNYDNLQQSFMGQQFRTNPDGSPMTNANGDLLMETGMTGMDMLQTGMGAAQLGLGFFTSDRQMDLGEDTLALKKRAYGDQRADVQRLRDKYASMAKREQDRQNQGVA